MNFHHKAVLHTSDGPCNLQLNQARGLWSRFRGLMLSRPLQKEPQPQGLLITRCPSVHGFFMLYSLDIVYLATDKSQQSDAAPNDSQTFSVTHTTNLRPWTISFGKNRTFITQQGTLTQRSAHALELPSGTVKSLGIAPGDRLEVFA